MKFLKRITRTLFRNDENDISMDEAKRILKEKKESVLVDVRSYQEYEEYHLSGAISIPLSELSTSIRKKVQNRETPIIVYCQSGNRSKKAMKILNNLCYSNVYNIIGGLEQ